MVRRFFNVSVGCKWVFVAGLRVDKTRGTELESGGFAFDTIT